MSRERILVIVTAAALALGVLFAALFAAHAAAPTPTATPAPLVTLDMGATPTGSPSSTGTPPPASTPSPTSTSLDGSNPSCAPGPDVCAGTPGIISNTAADQAAADSVRARVTPFIQAYLTLDSTEAPAARAVRLAPASAAVAGQVSVLTRPHTTLIGLSTKASPHDITRLLFLGRDAGALLFQASVNVDAVYTQPDGTGSYRVIGGSLTVGLDDAGTVVSVVEDFPTVAQMQ